MMKKIDNRYTVNISAGGITTFLNLIIGLLLARFLTHEIGLSGYALISMGLALQLAVNIFTSSMNGAISRYLTISLAKNDINAANQIFNSAFWGSIGVFILLLPIIAMVSWYSPEIFNATEGVEQVRIFVAFSLLSSLIMSLSAIFNSSAFSKNRFDLLGIQQTFLNLSRYGFTVLLILYWQVSVTSVGLGLFLSSIISLLLSVSIWRFLTPDLRVQITNFSKDSFLDLLGMGVWFSIDAIGMLLVSRVNTIILGQFVNLSTAGIYGLYLTLETMVYAVTGVVTSPFQPDIYTAYANSDKNALEKVLYSGVRITLAAMALFSSLILTFKFDLINIWLGKGYEAVSIPLVVGIPLLALSSAFSPYLAVLNAHHKTKVIAIATVFTSLGHLATVICLYIIGQLDLFSIALSSGLWKAIKMTLVAASIENRWKQTFNILLKIVLQFSVLFFLPLFVTLYILLPFVGGRFLVISIKAFMVFLTWFLLLFTIIQPEDFKRVLGASWDRSLLSQCHKNILVWRNRFF